MKFIAMRELKINPSRVLDRLAREDVVVTRRGKPAAALVRLDEDTLDEFIIAHHPTLLSEARAARAEYGKTGGIGHDEMKALVEKPRRRSLRLPRRGGPKRG